MDKNLNLNSNNQLPPFIAFGAFEELKELLNERQSHRQHIPNVGKQMFKQQLALVETLEKWIIDFENSLKEQN